MASVQTQTAPVQALLEAAAEQPGSPVSALPVVGAAERRLLLDSFAGSSMAPTELCHADQTIHGLLDHWAAATPDAPVAGFQVSAPCGCTWRKLFAFIVPAGCQGCQSCAHPRGARTRECHWGVFSNNTPFAYCRMSG